ncbi:hypothetical protein L6164_014223 [Bauhinia variegata]|uniref:Uncharacterized protein n=1 Tax=Bauhinia variegata TaxID=167791 RepID=A0ACB9NGU2_BAUVA|nr:hypothetical protein L6164_014223 [Bauhinia variegata]
MADECRTSGKPALLLSAAMAGHSQISPLDFYPSDEIKNNLDWINIMVYDFYLASDPNFSDKTQAPAFRGSGDARVTEWIQKGVPANKLVLGLPFYGHAWRFLDANNHGLNAPANGAADVDGKGSTLGTIIGTFPEAYLLQLPKPGLIATHGLEYGEYDRIRSYVLCPKTN